MNFVNAFMLKYRLRKSEKRLFFVSNLFSYFLQKINKGCEKGGINTCVILLYMSVTFCCYFFRLASIELRFPCLHVTYWASFEQQIGFEATIGEGHFSVAYQVSWVEIFKLFIMN